MVRTTPLIVVGGLLLLMMMLPVRGGGSEPTESFARRKKQADRSDPAAMLALGRWAEQHELPRRAMRAYRRVLDLKPEHPKAYDRLMRLARKTPLPERAQRRRELLDEFGDGFELHAAPHFLVVYNTDEAWAVNRAVLLERTHERFYEAFRQVDVRPRPLKKRLVCVLFGSRQRFAEYAKRTDDMEVGWSSGYYSTRTNRIAFYHDRQNPAFEKLTGELRTLKRRIDELSAELREARAADGPQRVRRLRRRLREARRQRNWHRNRRAALARRGNAAKTTHEATHQLSFNAGLQNRRVRYPFWLSEGLATNFEAPSPADPFGPQQPNPPRSRMLREARQRGLVRPLKAFVGLIRPTDRGEDRLRAAYAQAWGLFRFLYVHRHQQMRAYLQALSTPPPDRRDAEALRKRFVEAFGPMDRLRRQWQRFLRRAH